MVRERVSEWRSAWRSVLAGLAAGGSQLAILNGPFFAAQDRLFPVPPPDPQITLVTIDQESADNLGLYPLLNSYHALVIRYLASGMPQSPNPTTPSWRCGARTT